jgi:hypothetical protein
VGIRGRPFTSPRVPADASAPQPAFTPLVAEPCMMGVDGERLRAPAAAGP